MSLLFNRVIRVVFETPVKNIEVTGLRMNFKSDKTSDPAPNPSTCDIYNLSPKTLGLIQTKQTKISLYANYSPDDPNVKASTMIFTGDLAKVTQKRSGPDTVSTFECGDGLTSMSSLGGSLSFAPGTTMGQVLEKLQGIFSFQKYDLKGMNQNDVFNKGLAFTGMYRDLLSMLTKRQGVEWNVQNEQLHVLAPGDVLADSAIVLNRQTGLIGTPFRVRILRFDNAKKKDLKSPDRGVQCVSLLNGLIVPGRELHITSNYITGAFKCRNVSHHGDNYADAFYSEIEASDMDSGLPTTILGDVGANSDAGNFA